jgi:hypothetical protein
MHGETNIKFTSCLNLDTVDTIFIFVYYVGILTQF